MSLGPRPSSNFSTSSRLPRLRPWPLWGNEGCRDALCLDARAADLSVSLRPETDVDSPPLSWVIGLKDFLVNDLLRCTVGFDFSWLFVVVVVVAAAAAGAALTEGAVRGRSDRIGECAGEAPADDAEADSGKPPGIAREDGRGGTGGMLLECWWFEVSDFSLCCWYSSCASVLR